MLVCGRRYDEFDLVFVNFTDDKIYVSWALDRGGVSTEPTSGINNVGPISPGATVNLHHVNVSAGVSVWVAAFQSRDRGAERVWTVFETSDLATKMDVSRAVHLRLTEAGFSVGDG